VHVPVHEVLVCVHDHHGHDELQRYHWQRRLLPRGAIVELRVTSK
jgi:hypothetical protein